MRAASEAFARVVAGSHRVNVRVDLLFNREIVAEDIPVESGTVTYDRTAVHLGRLELVVIGSLPPVRWLTDANGSQIAASATTANITPYGAELQVWRGVELVGIAGADIVYDASGDPVLDAVADGDDTVSDAMISPTATGFLELLSMGVFPIQTVEVDAVTESTLVTAEDRSRLVSDALLEEDYVVAAGTNYATAIEALIEDGVAGLEFQFPTTEHTTPLLTFAAQEDRWEAAQRMAASIGMEIYFDGLGRVAMRLEPTFADAPVATISEGVNMISGLKSLDRTSAYNRVIAVGENASNGAVYRGVATDTDPESPTQYDKTRFGAKPRFYFSEFIASNAQATSAARAILAANLGVAKSIAFDAVPDPRLETGDAVTIVNTALGVDELHLLDVLTIGLTADQPMSGESRTNQEESV